MKFISVVGNIDRKRKTTPTTVYVMFRIDKNLIVEIEDLWNLILSTLYLNADTAPRTSHADRLKGLWRGVFSFWWVPDALGDEDPFSKSDRPWFEAMFCILWLNFFVSRSVSLKISSTKILRGNVYLTLKIFWMIVSSFA